MRTLIRNTDLKALFVGVGAAAAAGLLMGLAMQPNLRGPGEAEGPQIQAGVSGERQAYAYQGGAVSNYAGQVPDYVVGTDWLQPPEYAEDDEFLDVPAEEDTYVFAGADEEPVAVVRWQEPAREPVRYPSTDGGVAYGADLPPPPPPPEDPGLTELATTG